MISPFKNSTGDVVNVFDVAKYILQKQGTMSTMKLQKLVYYSQAWSLVWDEEPLFGQDIEAWANGPVVRELYLAHKGIFLIKDLRYGDISKLNDNQIETIDSVLKFYGDKSGAWLSDLTHSEMPWINARKGYNDNEICYESINLDDIYNYYSQL